MLSKVGGKFSFIAQVLDSRNPARKFEESYEINYVCAAAQINVCLFVCLFVCFCLFLGSTRFSWYFGTPRKPRRPGKEGFLASVRLYFAIWRPDKVEPNFGIPVTCHPKWTMPFLPHVTTGVPSDIRRTLMLNYSIKCFSCILKRFGRI